MGNSFPMSEPVVDKNTDHQNNGKIHVGYCAMQGWRMSMEDYHTIILDLNGDKRAAFFAVFDGHGGTQASFEASKKLHHHITKNPNFSFGNYKLALSEAFLSFDNELNDSKTLSGTTAVCLLIVDNKVYCANIGDSRGVACVDGRAFPLSCDHKPENELELTRILAAGGFVAGNRVNGNLALSRAFGDFQYKKKDLRPSEQAVSSCPDIEEIDADKVDFLVLACDGIWDVLTNEEVVEFILMRIGDCCTPDQICSDLTTICLATDYELVVGCDNMTIILICLTNDLPYDEWCAKVYRKYESFLSSFSTADDVDEYSCNSRMKAKIKQLRCSSQNQPVAQRQQDLKNSNSTPSIEGVDEHGDAVGSQQMGDIGAQFVEKEIAIKPNNNNNNNLEPNNVEEKKRNESALKSEQTEIVDKTKNLKLNNDANNVTEELEEKLKRTTPDVSVEAEKQIN